MLNPYQIERSGRLIIHCHLATAVPATTTTESTASLPAPPTSATTKCVYSMERAGSSQRLPVQRVILCSDAASSRGIKLVLKSGVPGQWKMWTRASATISTVPRATQSAASSLNSSWNNLMYLFISIHLLNWSLKPADINYLIYIRYARVVDKDTFCNFIYTRRFVVFTGTLKINVSKKFSFL